MNRFMIPLAATILGLAMSSTLAFGQHHKSPVIKPPVIKPPVIKPPVVHHKPPVVHHNPPPVMHHKPPVVHHKPPVVHHNPPVVHHNPPVWNPNPHVVHPNPPVWNPNPHVVYPNPPVCIPKPPVFQPTVFNPSGCPVVKNKFIKVNVNNISCVTNVNGLAVTNSCQMIFTSKFTLDPGDVIVSVGGVSCCNTRLSLAELVAQAYQTGNLTVVVIDVNTGNQVQTDLDPADTVNPDDGSQGNPFGTNPDDGSQVNPFGMNPGDGRQGNSFGN